MNNWKLSLSKVHMKARIGMAFIALLSWAPASAQDVPPPTPPLVAPVPKDADWIVTVQYSSSPSAAAPDLAGRVDRRISEVHSTKTDKFKRDIITYMNGTTEERWFIGSMYLWTPPHGDVSVYDLSNTPTNPLDTSPSVSSGFPGVGWIGLNHYDHVEIFDNASCYHYQDASSGIEAWINARTKLPLGYKSADAIYHFKFNPPPESLTLPPAYAKAWAACEKILDSR
jgi:hypothetical protein